ncbi:MAG: site-specific integrase [Burkholderiaceae bacterium]|jgi:integrase|nr:MAG: site-specific integrase [Burkholderiaceae bacterium]
MHDDLRGRSLTFPTLPLGDRQTPPDLTRLLYKGGASVRKDEVAEAIQQGQLGGVLPERVDLVVAVHEHLAAALARGGQPSTVTAQIRNITAFFAWAEKRGATLSIAEVQRVYVDWSEHLLHRITVIKDLKLRSAHGMLSSVGPILNGVLGRSASMLRLTRVRPYKRRKPPRGAKADKQNLEATFAFGRLLQAICDGLGEAVIRGPRPVRIPLQDGVEFVPFTGRRPSLAEEERRSDSVRVTAERDLAYANDTSLKSRAPLINLRIEAELLMFIGQTAMNLAQAQGLAFRHFNFSSSIDGYQVRSYKHRRGGEVLFEIYSEYRSHFERYLAWRRSLFPGSKQLFPFIRNGAHESAVLAFVSLKRACNEAGVPWVPPSALRNTRVNWLLRRSGDPELTADMAQHHQRTLLNDYERPSQQRAIVEVTRFWRRNDPALAGLNPEESVAPGECDGIPQASPLKPASAPEADCQNPSGCLWCYHHRDIDTLDYVWSLACFRHLKILESSRYCPPTKERRDPHPADHAIKRLSEKLAWFRDSNAKRRGWVEEALARVEEGRYHDQWAYLIEDMEGRPE